jgi:hypothetical protein
MPFWLLLTNFASSPYLFYFLPTWQKSIRMYILITMIAHLTCILCNDFSVLSTILVLYNKLLKCYYLEQVFSCDQKLYTKPQLNKHIKNGDSEVDGSKVERRGFVGHPMCGFCKIPFYGKEELYTHVTREHFSCHICQRCSTTVILLGWA